MVCIVRIVRVITAIMVIKASEHDIYVNAFELHFRWFMYVFIIICVIIG